MSRNFKKIKGKVFAEENTTIKTYYKDGQLVKEKNSNKINKYSIHRV